MTYYVYILQCADGKRYYGYTEYLERRLKEHNQGRNKSTRHRRPVKLAYYETFLSRSEAMKREKQLKNGRTRKETVEKLIKDFLLKDVKGYT